MRSGSLGHSSPFLGRQLLQFQGLRAAAAPMRNFSRSPLASSSFKSFQNHKHHHQRQQQWHQQSRSYSSWRHQQQHEGEEGSARGDRVLAAGMQWSSSLVRIGKAEILFMLSLLAAVGGYHYVKKFEENPGIMTEVAEAYSQGIQHELEYLSLRERLDGLMAEDAELDEGSERKAALAKQLQSLYAKIHRVMVHQTITTFEQVLENTRNLAGPDDYRLLSVLRKLAFQKRRLVQFQLQYQKFIRKEDRMSRKELQKVLDQIQDYYTDMIRIAQLEFGRTHRQVVHATLDLASFFFELEDYTNCQQALLTAWERLQEGATSKPHAFLTKYLLGQDHERLNLDTEIQLAQMISETYRLQPEPKVDEAVDWAGVALVALERLQGEEHWKVGILLTRISSLLSQSGRFPEAESTARRSLEIAKRYFPDETLPEVVKQQQLFQKRDDGPAMQLRLASMTNLGHLLVQKGLAGDVEATHEGKHLIREALNLAIAGNDQESLRSIQNSIADLKLKL